MALSLSVSVLAEPRWTDALGSLQDLPHSERRWYLDGDAFEFLPSPRGESVARYLHKYRNTPNSQRGKLYIYQRNLSLHGIKPIDLRNFLKAFFQMPVIVVPNRPDSLPEFWNGKVSAEELQADLRLAVPKDAFAVIALVEEDLYSEDGGPDYLLFGQGHYWDRTAVASTERLLSPEPRLFRHRVYKLVCHELLHTFGMGHCGYFRCLMNTSLSIQESDARPLHLCPVCLRKLSLSHGFDIADRYRQLERASRNSLAEDKDWFKNRF